MTKEFEFRCNDEETGQRLDIFLFNTVKKNCNELISRSRIKSLIESRCVQKDNDYILSPSTKTISKSIYKIFIPTPVQAKPAPEKIELDVLYEDNDVIIINKKVGMVVHPGHGNYTGTLVNALLNHCRDTLSGIGGISRPGIVHRIDKDTSGILVVAKNDFAHNHLSNQFKEHSITRTYLALVWGIIKNKSGTIENKISRHPYNRKKMSVSNNGKVATTHWNIQETFFNLATLVKCKLETGRTHQIRVHFSNLGNHLVGDKVYSNQKAKKQFLLKKNQEMYNHLKLFPRQALHANHLSFNHPKTNKRLSFDVQLPKDMQDLLCKLGKTIEKQELITI